MALDPKDYPLGEEIAEAQIERKEPGLVVSARLDRSDARRLIALAKATDRTLSQVVREAIGQYLDRADRDKTTVAVPRSWGPGYVVVSPEQAQPGPAVTTTIPFLRVSFTKQ